jgi:hypothetical protein
MRAGVLLGTALFVLAGAAPAGLAAKKPGRKGAVKLVRNATSDFAGQLQAAEHNGGLRRWMKGHYWQMRGYDPFFADHTFKGSPSWNPPPTQEYENLYAIYRGSGDAIRAAHPSWVLRNAANPNEQLYIPYGCGDAQPGCPAFAADIGNPAFRDWWIQRARSTLRGGYSGLAIDDVNLSSVHTGNAAGVQVPPRDPRTGQPMTLANWKRYTAAFIEEIASAFPNKQVTVNANQWWVPHDSSATRIARAADFTELERGFNDGGIIGGAGTFGYLTLLAQVDWIHDRGGSVMYQPYSLEAVSREFELASYFLVKARSDAIISKYQADRLNWWSGWETYLGKPAGRRYVSASGLLRRDFVGGSVFVNQPGAPIRAESLPERYSWTDLGGTPLTSITLGARNAKVLLKRGASRARLKKPECLEPQGNRKVLVKGRITGERGKRIDPGYVNRIEIDLERKDGGRWVRVAHRRLGLRRKDASFRQRFNVDSFDSANYRATVRFKGNSRYFPAPRRRRGCAY